MYSRLRLDEKTTFAKTKMILSIYRDVVWAASSRADELAMASHEELSYDLGAALMYLNDFAPTEQRQAFEDKVSGLFETKWYIELIDTAMIKLHDYHMNGMLYYEILSKVYVSVLRYSEADMLELLSLERSAFFDRKKEAIMVFGVALWRHAIPRIQEIINDMSMEADLISIGK